MSTSVSNEPSRPNHGGLNHDQFAYERAKLRYMLQLRTPDGRPVVWAETLLREYVEELADMYIGFTATPRDLWDWAFSLGEDHGGHPHNLCFLIDAAYRQMVGAWDRGYHPDWLCVPISPRLGHPRFQAWDPKGRRIV